MTSNTVEIKEEFLDYGFDFPDNSHFGWAIHAVNFNAYKSAPDFYTKDYPSTGAILRYYQELEMYLIRGQKYDQKCGQAITSLDINQDGKEDLVFSCPHSGDLSA